MTRRIKMFTEINPAFLIAALFLFVSGCYLYLCITIFTSNTKSKSRNDYLSSGMCLILYSLCFGLMTITINETLYKIFWAIGFISSCMFFSRWLVFSSNMIDIKRKYIRQLINATSFVALVLSVLCVVSDDALFVMSDYGIRFSYNKSLFFIIMVVYLLIVIAAFLYVIFRWWREAEMKRNRIQALLFLILSTLIAPVGFVTDFALPTFTENTTIPIASICFLPISLPLIISMRKYKTLSITVPNASGYVFNTVTIPTLVLDSKNIIKLENMAAYSFFGCSVIGKNISEIILTNDKIKEQSFFNTSFTNEKISVETPQGVRICDLLLAVENDKYSDALCKVVLLRDITENELKDNMLKVALDRANIASKAKSNFLSNMSHEIRTPMNAIIGMTTIGKQSNNIGKKDDALNKISSASKHLLGVINDILDMSKIEADKLELSSASFDFEKMLQNVANVIAFRSDERRQKFYVNIGDNIPKTLIGDDQRLSQVITNLLGNAVKFTPSGGTVRLDSKILSAEDDICQLQISVEDTGIGITSEQISRLFQPFEQAEIDTSRKFGGTGLGLAISKRIVELMGGKIWVESELGKGSKFIFTIFVKYDSKENKPLLCAKENLNDKHILVINNEKETINFFSVCSKNLGISCVAATNSEEVIAELNRKEKYDIYFIDWDFLSSSDIDLIKTVQSKATDRPIVITYSPIDWNDIENKTKVYGINKFLSKPLFPYLTIEAIHECLGIVDAKKQDFNLNQVDDFSGHSILLAEDVEINREILMSLLEPTAINVECASNGKQALELFKKSPKKYGLIFMDIQMPEMDGYEATQRIRKLSISSAKTIPIIAMTANVFREDIDKCLQSGMNGHIGKPIDIDEVIAQLRNYLNK